MTFVVKALRLGSRMSCHAYIVEQDDVMVSIELLVSKYVDSSSEIFKKMVSSGSTDSSLNWTSFLKDLEDLHGKYKKEVMVKLMPEVEDLANQMRFNSNTNNSQNQQNQQRDPLRVDRGPNPPRFEPRMPSPSFGDDFDDLTGGIGEPPSFGHYGDSDLFGAVGRYGQVPGGFRPGGFGGSSGGSSVGPHHPGFGPQVNDPYATPGGGRGGGGNSYYHPPPPGARFDPFGPPINPGAGPRPNPNPPDAPPGFDNWYS
jgi:hypothetical protein